MGGFGYISTASPTYLTTCSDSDRNLSRRLFNLLLGSADGCTTTTIITTITTTIRSLRPYYYPILFFHALVVQVLG